MPSISSGWERYSARAVLGGVNINDSPLKNSVTSSIVSNHPCQYSLLGLPLKLEQVFIKPGVKWKDFGMRISAFGLKSDRDTKIMYIQLAKLLEGLRFRVETFEGLAPNETVFGGQRTPTALNHSLER